MKNLFKVIFVFSAFVVFATITSCNNELHEVSSFNNETIEFSKLLNSIDSLIVRPKEEKHEKSL